VLQRGTEEKHQVLSCCEKRRAIAKIVPCKEHFPAICLFHPRRATLLRNPAQGCADWLAFCASFNREKVSRSRWALSGIFALA
jgi:hypothetical protein